MAIKWDEVVAETIVGSGVAVITTVVIGVPTLIGYGIYNWWENRKFKKQRKETDKRTKEMNDLINKIDENSVIEFKVKSKY